ncbi:hypothetical protein Tco_1285135 [Tanacetum coccineum]
MIKKSSITPFINMLLDKVKYDVYLPSRPECQLSVCCDLLSKEFGTKLPTHNRYFHAFVTGIAVLFCLFDDQLIKSIYQIGDIFYLGKTSMIRILQMLLELIEESFGYHSPRFTVPLRYRKILLDRHVTVSKPYFFKDSRAYFDLVNIDASGFRKNLLGHKVQVFEWLRCKDNIIERLDYPIWEVIQNGNGPVSITTDTQGQIKVLPPRIAEEILARERERKARNTLLMALPEDHLVKFHKMTDAREMWEAIKSRFGGNDESKKMQRYILKQQFEGFSVSNSERLHKGYDRFQSLLSQLEIHGAGVSTKDAYQKFLRSLPSAWSQVSLIMRTKPGVNSLSFDDLYNNLRVFENYVKGSTTSSSSTQNVAFVSENTSSTNDVSTAYGVSNPASQNSQHEHASSYSLLANQSSCP